MPQPLIISVVFDGAISLGRKPPDFGMANRPLIAQLQEAQKAGHQVILITRRTKEPLEIAVKFCQHHGLIFNAVYGGTRKEPECDLRIDGQSIHPVALEQWGLQQVLQSLDNPNVKWGWKYEPLEDAFPNTPRNGHDERPN